MPLSTKERNFPYPAKSESFDSSWTTFQEFFNLLDREFSSFLNFTIGTGIKYLWIVENEMIAQQGMKYGDFGIRTDTGGVYEYRQYVGEEAKPGWKFKYDVNSLPLNINRDPTPDDWGMPIGFNWINNTSGESFYCLKNEIGACVWVSEEQAIGYEVREGYFVPAVDYKFQGSVINGIMEETGRFYYLSGETSIKLLIGAKEVGNIILEPGRSYYSPGDLDILQFPESDIDNAGKCNSSLNERYLSLVGKISTRAMPTYNKFKKISLSASVLEIISTDDTLAAEIDRLHFSELTFAEKKEYLYDYYHTITYLEAVNNDIKKVLLRCMACSGLASYDGNEVTVDGNIILADGNILPPCA